MTATTKLFATKAECQATIPADSESLKPFEVSRAGVVLGWVAARSTDTAVNIAARETDHYAASTGSRPAVPAKIATAVAALSDADLAALGLVRTPAAALVA